MTILVTGGAGYIGSHMVHELVDAGERVVVLDNLSTGFRFLIPGTVPFVAGSTGDRALVGKTIHQHGVTAIIHFAASIVVPESLADPLGYYRNNTMNTCTLLDVANETGVKQFIFSSTAAVYGNPQAVPVREDAPTLPISPYGSSKLMSEIMLHDAGRAYGLRFVVLRYFNVAGADPKRRTGQSTPAATHLIKVACEAALGKRPKIDDLRHRLSDARRHLRPRLHPCQRSGARAFGGARLSAPRRRQRDLQLRLWPRRFGARGDRRGQAREPARLPGRAARAPRRRSGRLGGRRRPHPREPRLAPAIRGSRHDCVATRSPGSSFWASARARRPNRKRDRRLSPPY